MGYSKKKRYRKKRGGAPNFNLDNDLKYAQIYNLIEDPIIRGEVIKEINKGYDYLFTSADNKDIPDPGTLDIELFKTVLKTAKKVMFETPDDALSSTAADIDSASTDISAPILKNPVGFTSFEIAIKTAIADNAYDEPKNIFLRKFVRALYDAHTKTRDSIDQERAFLKDLFTNTDVQTYIDDLYTPKTPATVNNTLEIVVAANIVTTITFKKDVAINSNELSNLSKLSGLKTLIISDILKANTYSKIKSPSVETVEITDDELTDITELVFLEACPNLTSITISASNLAININDVLEKLPSSKEKTVDLKNTNLTLNINTDFDKFISFVKSKKTTSISLPDAIKFNTETQKSDFEKALHGSWFGKPTTTGVETNAKFIEKYTDLKKCFPVNFRIEEKEDSGVFKYNVFEESSWGNSTVCEFTTSAGTEENSRTLTEITFKKGSPPKITLDGFTILTQITFEKSDLTMLTVTNCAALTSIVGLEGLSKLETVNIANVAVGFTSLSMTGCKSLTTITALPVSLTTLTMTEAPIQNTDFLKPLTALTSIDLTGCDKFGALSNLNDKTKLVTLILTKCSALSELVLDGYTVLTTIKVEGIRMALKTVTLTSELALTELLLPSSVTNLTVSGLLALKNSNFLTGLDILESLSVNNCATLASINLNLCNRRFADKKFFGSGCVANLKELTVTNCTALTKIDGLDGLSKLTSVNITGTPGITVLSMTGCKSLTTITALPISLTIITMTGCESLIAIPDWSLLVALTLLKMTGCKILTKVGKLPTSLKTLYISWNSEDSIILPRTIETKLDNLTFLNALKDNLETLTLKGLNIGACELTGFTKLKTLKITEQEIYSYKKDKSNMFYDKIGLTSLTITDAENLETISRLPSTLTTLVINNSSIRNDTANGFLKNLDKLETLTLKSYVDYKIDSLPSSLKELILDHSKIQAGWKIFSKISSLETLAIENDSTITTIDLIAHRTSLKTLKLIECNNLSTISDINAFSSLTSLEIGECKISKIVINDCKNLKNIFKLPSTLIKLIINKSKIEESDFTTMINLETFTFTDNSDVKSIDIVDVGVATIAATVAAAANQIKLPNCIKTLTIIKSSIERLTLLPDSLETCIIDDCAALVSDLNFESFNKLTTLSVKNCPKVKSFVVNNCPALTIIKGLTDMTALETLTITENGSVKKGVLIPNFDDFSTPTIQNIILKGSSTNLLTIESTTQVDYNFKNVIALKTIEITNLKIVNKIILDKNERESEILILKFKKMNIKSISLTNIKYKTDTYTNNSVGLSVISCPNLTSLIIDKETNFKQIIVRDCSILTSLPIIDDMNSLTDLSIAGLPITKLSVTNCNSLKKIYRLTDLNKLETITVSNNKSLTTIDDIAGLIALESVYVSECPVLLSLTIKSFIDTKNEKLTNIKLSKLPGLNSLTIEESLLTKIDLSDIPIKVTVDQRTETKEPSYLTEINISKNTNLTTISGLINLTMLQTINVSENALKGTIEDFLGGLINKYGENISLFLNDNPALTLGDEDNVITNINNKKVTSLYRNGTDTVEKNNKIKDILKHNTDFTGDNVESGTHYEPKFSIDLTNLCKILGKAECDEAFYITINAALMSKNSANFNNTIVTFMNQRITTLVLDGSAVAFEKLINLDALESLTIQNNNNAYLKEFNKDGSKVLPTKLKELIITNCENFEMVNLDQQKATLETVKIKVFTDKTHNTFIFTDFNKLETVEIGKTNLRNAVLNNCKVLTSVILDKDIKEVTIKNTPKIQLSDLNTLTSINELILDIQPNPVFTADLQAKIKKLVLKNMTADFVALKGEFQELSELKIINCATLNEIDIISPNLVSMVTGECTKLVKINTTSVANTSVANTSVANTSAATTNTTNKITGLVALKTINILGSALTTLEITGCPILETMSLPLSLTELKIEDLQNGIIAEAQIISLTNLSKLTLNKNTNLTTVDLPELITEFIVTGDGFSTLNCDKCINSLTKLEINSSTFGNLNVNNGNNSLNNYNNLQTLTITNGIMENLEITNCIALTKVVNLPASLTSLNVSNCSAIESANFYLQLITQLSLINSGKMLLFNDTLKLSPTITVFKIETNSHIKSIVYEGTAMVSFDVYDCVILTTIPTFEKNDISIELLSVQICPSLELVKKLDEYLASVASVASVEGVASAAPGIVAGGSVKSRKTFLHLYASKNPTLSYKGITNKHRTSQKKRFRKNVYRGGAFESIKIVNFTGSQIKLENIDNLITVIGTKKIKQIHFPESIKNFIQTEKKANGVITALTKNNDDPKPSTNVITNIEIQPDEQYTLTLPLIINGLKTAFKTEVLEEEEADRLKTERQAAEEANRQEAETDRLETERQAAETARLQQEATSRQVETARLETERLAAETARLQQEATSRQVETARLETERLAAEEAETARLETERQAQETDRKTAANLQEAETARQVETEKLAAKTARQQERLIILKSKADELRQNERTTGQTILNHDPLKLLWVCEKNGLRRECESTKKTTYGKIDGQTLYIYDNSMGTKPYVNHYDNIIIAFSEHDNTLFGKNLHFILSYRPTGYLNVENAYFKADTTANRDQWIKDINLAISDNDNPLSKP